MTRTSASAPPVVSLDPAALQRLLDGQHAEIRARVKDMLCQPEFLPLLGLSVEQHRARVLAGARILATSEDGGTSLGFPVAYGGRGEVGASIAAFETLALGDLSLLVKCGVQFGLFGGAVLHLGTQRHHERYLSDIATFALPGCFAMTEADHGSNVQAIATTATYDPDADELVVHTPHHTAHKEYIGNAARDGRMAAVFVQLVVAGEGHGVHCVLVPIRDEQDRVRPGVRIEDSGEKLGLNGVDNGRLWFEHVRVPREALLDRYGHITQDGRYESPIESPGKRFFTMLGTLVQGRVSVSGASQSATKSALTIAVRHALRRRQFGAPDSERELTLLDYRTHQRRLLPALAKTYALHFAQERLVAHLHAAFTDEGHPERARRELETEAAGIKAIATWHATHTIQACREACGGAGYMSVNRFGVLKADTDVFTTFEGDNTVLLQLVAKSLLTDYKDQFGELDPMGLVSFMAGQVLEVIAEKSAARELFGRLVDDLVPNRDDDVGLLDREYHQGLFRWREHHILTGVARRLKRGVDAGADPFEVFLACQDHVIAAARAHVERLVLDAFVAAIERCAQADMAAVLNCVCDLYVLSEVEADRGWFQEHGKLSSTRSKAITRTVNRLCADLRGHASTLVDAFGIPDALLAAPIGVRDDGGGRS